VRNFCVKQLKLLTGFPQHLKIESGEVPMQFNEAKRILKTHKNDLAMLGVNTLAIFGSVATNKSKKSSDVDILIEFDAKKGLFGFVHLKDYLQDILHCDVDLVTKKGLHPALKERILSESRKIF
jgi:predicted nucleotidyltransferase